MSLTKQTAALEKCFGGSKIKSKQNLFACFLFFPACVFLEIILRDEFMKSRDLRCQSHLKLSLVM